MLPSGTVTFLFTDIEGSTKLWEQNPDEMRKALAVHEAILREEIARHGGHLFKTVGDGVYAAFGDAPSAIAAARNAQQRLVETTWPVPGDLRVRMALHTGTAQPHGDDYLGPTLNRAARILSAGHGGQILVSESTRTLAGTDLPQGSTLRDQGLHQLRDLAQPEHIFQFVSAGLPDTFPDLRSLDAFPHNLPRQLTSFVGREREMMDVKNLIQTSPLLTLTGSSGSGKTRLALQVGAELVETFNDGVWLVELDVVTDPTMVLRSVASAVGVHEELSFAARPLANVLVDTLRERSLLLILDNCEHVLGAAADAAALLLRACPEVHILATSQERLGIAGERVYQVLSLSVPGPEPSPPSDRLAEFEAVRLFVERAVLSQPRFALTEANAPAVREIVQQLEGIPLAIELAAARVKVLPVDQIAARLDERFRLLTAGPRTDAPRHQTLRAALDWSYDLLSEEERGLLRRLSVFAGSFDLESVEAICGDLPGVDVLELLTRLVEKSLVIFDEQNGRYRLLETVRLYGQEKLSAAGEDASAHSRHRDWYLMLAVRAEPGLTGPEQMHWLDRLEIEHDNFRTALRWSLTIEDDPEALFRLAGALWRFWEIRGHWTEGRKWLESTLTKTAGVDSPSRVKVSSGAANLAYDQGDFPRAQALGEESLALAQKFGDKRGTVVCLTLLGLEACSIENWGKARELGAESLRLSHELGDSMGIAGGLAILGLVERGEGDTAKAIDHFKQSLERFQALGDRLRSSFVLLNLGLVYRESGDLQQAKALFEESLALFKALGDRWGIAFSQSNLGIVAWNQREFERAKDLFKQSLALRAEIKEKRGIATSLVGLAAVDTMLEQFERAALLFGAAEALRESLDVALPPFIRKDYDGLVAVVREKLAADVLQRAWARGRTTDQDQIIDYALEGMRDPRHPSAA